MRPKADLRHGWSKTGRQIQSFMKWKRMTQQNKTAASFLLTVLAANVLAACGLNGEVSHSRSHPSMQAPFDLGTAGYVLDRPFEATGKRIGYAFNLVFLPENERQLHTVKTLLEYSGPNFGRTRVNSSGETEWIRHGIKIPLRLTISREASDGSTVVYVKSFDRLLTTGGGNNGYLPNQIDAPIWLDPGTYRIRLETLEAVPELSDVPVVLNITVPGNK